MQKKRFFLVFLLTVFTVTIFNDGFGGIFFVNTTGSVPRGLYMRIPGVLRCGDLVVYRPTDEVQKLVIRRGYNNSESMLFMKYVGALECNSYGVNIKDLSFEVKGKIIGKAMLKDSNGLIMPIKFGANVVPQGHFLPIAKTERSFDGRYTGTESLDRIRARVIPILVEW